MTKSKIEKFVTNQLALFGVKEDTELYKVVFLNAVEAASVMSTKEAFKEYLEDYLNSLPPYLEKGE